MRKMEKYLAIFKLSFLHALKNYKALIGLSIFLMTCLVIFAHLWKIAAAKTGVVYLNPDQLLWYIAFNEWVIVSIPDIQDDMEQDLRSGRLAYLLPRPISYLGATFAEAAGTLSVNLLVLGLVTFLFTWWQVGGLPFHPMGFPIQSFLDWAQGLLPYFSNAYRPIGFLAARSSPIFLDMGKAPIHVRRLDASPNGLSPMDANFGPFYPFPRYFRRKKRIGLRLQSAKHYHPDRFTHWLGTFGFSLSNASLSQGVTYLERGRGVKKC